MTTVGIALLVIAALLVVGAAVVLVRALVGSGTPLGSRVTGAVLGLVVLAVIAAAFGLNAAFHIAGAMNTGATG